MEYLTSSSGIQNSFNQCVHHVVVKQIPLVSYSSPSYVEAMPRVSKSATNSFHSLPRRASLSNNNVHKRPMSNLGHSFDNPQILRSSSALGGSLGSLNAGSRARNSLQYDSLNDPHLRDYFERKFQLSSAKTKRFKERKPGPGEVVYRVKVRTGNLNNAGTDASVYLTINGKRGDLTRKRLFNKYESIKTDDGYKFRFQRNSTNVFKLIGIDVGQLTHIVIEHDGQEVNSCWFLQDISITNTKTHRTWIFDCNDWLSLHHGLNKTKINLLPKRELEKYSMTDYKIIVVTGDRLAAGTDSNVFITLFGPRNKQSPRLALKNNQKNLFERGQTDTFKLNTNYVGPIQKVRIEHDNSGKSPGWFLERIVITDLKDPNVNYYCPCSRWLSKDEDDGLISRDLIATDDIFSIRKVGKYLITIFTGDKRNAGTDADVRITLYGKQGDSGEHLLDTSKKSFERGQIDKFSIDCPSLGELTKIQIGHNNKGSAPGWFLNKVIVDDTILKRVYEFAYNDWLADNEGDGKTTVFLYPSNTPGQAEAQPGVPYKLLIHTGDVSGASTKANVYIELVGGRTGEESSGRIALKEGQFKRDMVDELTINVPKMLSPLEYVVIGHDNTSSKPKWFLDQVDVICPSIGMKQVFPCGKWLAKDEDDGRIERVLKENRSLRETYKAKAVWNVWVYTSDTKNAGTDSNVYMVLYGDRGKTDEIKLKSVKESFEPGKCDEFKIDTEEIGQPFKIRVGHDNTGRRPGWHLDRIEMENVDSKERFVFKCNRWLADDQEDKEIVRELPAEGDTIRKPLPIVNYEVEVHTGKKSSAGTNADVFVNIFGEWGDTGERVLKKSQTNKNPFEKGKVDVFKVEAVTLKHLNKIRIGHNGKRAGAGWFLDRVVVRQEGTSKYDQTFECNRWLAVDEDDGLIVRELFVDGLQQQLDSTTYNIKVKTGDVRNAGTDARVKIQLFGEKGATDYRHLKNSDNTFNKFERNRLDEFRIEAEDIGKIEKIRIGHNGKGVASGWFLDYVEVDVPSKGKRYKFAAHRWLDENEEDRKTEIDLYPTDVTKMRRYIPYVITTKTGKKQGAGTDADVFIQFYGKEGKSEEYVLKNNSDNFEKGKEDVFKIDADDVGPIYKVRIGHNNKGASSGWYLDSLKIQRHALKGSKRLKKNSRQNSVVSLDVPEIETYHFDAKCWFAKDEGDRQIVRELVAYDEDGRPIDDVEEVPYEVKVYTGDKSGAGTDANVFMTLYGTNGDSGEREMAKSDRTNKFERNKCDTFTVKAVDLGELLKLKIRHDNSKAGSAWYLEKIEVYNPLNDKQYLFNCQNWLSEKEGDGKISRELMAIDPSQLKRVKFRSGVKDLKDQFLLETEDLTTKYNVSVVTSDVKNAGTNSNVFIQLFGDKHDSGKIPLESSFTNKNPFERGQTDKFEVKEADVGDIRKILIGHDGRGVGSGWHLKEIIIDAPKLGKKWRFPCGRWLDKNEDDGKTQRELYPSDLATEEYKPSVLYEVAVFTSDKSGADTSANPYIVLYGDEVRTPQVDLCKNKAERKGKFKRGACDRFVLELEDVGKIRKIRVGHDNKGMGAGWHLDRVEIRRLKSNGRGSNTYVFPCGRWLARDEDDKAIERDLVPEKVIDEQVEDGETYSKEKKLKRQLEMRKYVCEVFTGNVSGAGTDSNVFLTIFGELGDSGERELVKSETHRNKFERNHMDRFTIESADLGPLSKIKIRHDNSSLLSADWYLDRVEINDGSDKYLFLAERWLSKSKGEKKLEATLFEQDYKGPRVTSTSSMSLKSNIGSSHMSNSNSGISIRQHSPFGDRKQYEDGRYQTYKISIQTGDERNCGVSAQVFIRLFGENKKKSERVRLELAKKKKFEPGSTESFEIEALDVGDLRKVELGHEGAGPNESWLVKSIEIHNPTKGKSYFISCNQWLSTEKGDGQTVRMFYVDDATTKISTYAPMVPYKMLIYTANESQAGTDSNVTMKFFGSKGNSNDIFIEKMENRFDRGAVDELNVELDQIGALKKVRVSHDAKGSRRDWLLDRIEMTNMKTGKSYLFVCQEWLSKSKKGSKGLSIDLPVYKHGEETIQNTDYKISVKTSDLSGAGTNARVYLTIFGENGDSGEFELKDSETNFDKFERNKTDVFALKQQLSLGELTKCRIRHDNSGRLIGNTNWHLEHVKIEDLGSGKQWLFECNKWLSLSKDDKQIVRELTPNVREDDGRSTPRAGERTVYEISVQTADESNAGTKQNAYIILIGDRNEESKPKYLDNTSEEKILRRGQTDKFTFKTRSVGTLKKIILAHVSQDERDTREQRNVQWICQQVKVKDTNTGTAYIFPVNDVLVLNAKPKVYRCEERKESMVNMARSLKNVEYQVKIVTGSDKQAGMSSKAFITMFGENGDTGKRALKKGFERDSTETFNIECLDLGELRKIFIEHDNSGFNKSWLVDSVEIKNGTTGQTWLFPCQKWLSKDKGDGEIARELYPTSKEDDDPRSRASSRSSRGSRRSLADFSTDDIQTSTSNKALGERRRNANDYYADSSSRDREIYTRSPRQYRRID